ncbi:peripheral myelin protein 22a isoform X1 [Danio rerio]|uniref:Peripheral myelin protein 22a isoform X1 n=2 Tax=Danio rerio TaxID=7955 RepID=A0A8M2BBU0_DANRE|nr:peripheral myelin protein 22a isoform X1 [Danio rerio]|eukprot:XP_005164496.1 peripheral myelin protein 22a isoform X1 [Danio rerio]
MADEAGLAKKPKMLVILFATIVLHLTSLIILFIATCASAWRTHGDTSYDLWYDCTQINGGYKCSGNGDADWLQAVQALMVLATIFCLISFIIFLCQLFTLVKGGRFFFTAVFQILASLFVMSGAIIYTVMSPQWKNDSDTYGYAFVLAWLAFPLTLISGLIYIILRKKE